MKSNCLRIITAATLLMITWPISSMAQTAKSFPDRLRSWSGSEAGNWFLAGAIGIQRPIVDSRYTVPNGSSYTPPSNVDSYSTDINYTAALNIDGGYRWIRESSFIPAWALGLRYAHSFSEDIGGQIMQYSLPDYTNYNYSWDIYSDIFMAIAKFDLFQWRNILPYLSVGGGVAYNTAANYNEYAMSGIDPRTSPQYGRNTKAQPAYSLGVGFDWHVKPAFLVSLGYEYQNLGTISSGNAVGSWTGSHLQSGTYQTSSVMLGLTWLLT